MKIGKYELSVPIIQGGMGIGVSLSNLAGNVAKCGAMGILSSVNAGFKEADFNTSPVKANLRAIENEIKKALHISEGNGIVGVNIMVAVNHYEETVKAAIKAGAQAIISGAGLPMKLPEYVENEDALLAPIVSSGRAASTICAVWDKRYNRCPDFMVIEGPKAGGHLGFKREDILDGSAMSPDEILPEVLSEISTYEEKYGKKIPVFCGGGIYDGNDMARVMKLGASGVQIGTRFIATNECDASQTYKDMMINAKKEDVVIVKSPVGLPGRALRTKLIKNLENGISLAPERCNDCLKACPHGSKAPYCISRALVAAVEGNVDDGLFFCGENVFRIDKIIPVADLIDEIYSKCKLNFSYAV